MSLIGHDPSAAMTREERAVQRAIDNRENWEEWVLAQSAKLAAEAWRKALSLGGDFENDHSAHARKSNLTPCQHLAEFLEEELLESFSLPDADDARLNACDDGRGDD